MTTVSAAAAAAPPQLIHQPPKRDEFVPDPVHVALFEALQGMTESLPGRADVVPVLLPIRGQALMIAYLTDEVGTKRVAKMSAKDVREWVLAFRRQNPRLWVHFENDHLVQLDLELSYDPAHVRKPIAEWQHQQTQILRSAPRD